jgi:hypothetical protein
MASRCFLFACVESGVQHILRHKRDKLLAAGCANRHCCAISESRAIAYCVQLTYITCYIHIW